MNVLVWDHVFQEIYDRYYISKWYSSAFVLPGILVYWNISNANILNLVKDDF